MKHFESLRPLLAPHVNDAEICEGSADSRIGRQHSAEVTLGLVELLFSYAVSQRIFRETLSVRELCGMGLLAIGVLGVTLSL